MKPFVQIANLTQSFSPKLSPALFDINANLEKGKIIGLAGSDGAGKTTLIRLIAGLLIPSDGKITIDGCDTVTDSEKIHAMTGYMPQRFGLYEDLTVMQNLQLYASLRGVDPSAREETFFKFLQFTDLTPFTKRLARDLSGGMKQKLGLACSLLKKPKLLLLDEPSVGVDPISRRELWKMVHGLLDENICILWSTTYLDEAERCDQVLLLNEGELYFFGKPSELTDKMKGKVFLAPNVDDKRATLRKLMKNDSVVDGVIEGNDLRLVLKEKNSLGIKLVETKPRFEDAFVDILGGEKTVFPPPDKSWDGAVQFPVVAEHLTKRFKEFTAVSQVTFQVKKGEVFGLLGPNGAGKSTTFKMLTGLLRPTMGGASINGIDLNISPVTARSHFGYMAQKFSLYGNLTVLQNLEFFAGVYIKEKKETVERLIEQYSLTPFLHSFCDPLPIGFKQRLSFAIATMHEPEVLFLDEPTSGMDPVSRRFFWRKISSLAEKGCTVLVTTHFMDEAENCDRIALIYQSKIIYLGDTLGLKKKAETKENPNPTLDDAFIRLIEEQHAKP